MHIAIIGAGFAGLAAAYELQKKGHQVTILERAHTVGGLGAGFKHDVSDYPNDWEWDLEKFYHHWFTNDQSIIALIKELGWEKDFLIQSPSTASWYQGQAYRLDSPVALLSFKPLSIIDRIRTGIVLAVFKLLPNGQFLERWKAHDALPFLMGKRAYAILWEPLLKGKFSDHYQEINLAWFWARIYKRTPKLGYFKGGFQSFANKLAEHIRQNGGIIRLGVTVTRAQTEQDKRCRLWLEDNDEPIVADRILVTTSPHILFHLFPQLPDEYRRRYSHLKAIGAHVLILALDQPFLPDSVYWLNIHESSWPFLILAEHTNLIDKQHYGGQHLLYVGDYLDKDHPFMQQSKETFLQTCLPYLQEINPHFSLEHITHSWLWRTPYAQPIVEVHHSQQIPPIATPLPSVYLACMSQVYPWDRGTNYAVEIGQRAATLIDRT